MVDLTGAGKNYKIKSKMHKIAKNLTRAPLWRLWGKGKAKPSPVAGKKRKHGDDLIPVGGASLGDRVVALYRGDEANQWFPGRVTAVHSDDTYDIKYDDGDEDERLPVCYLSTNVDRFDDE